MGFSIVPNMESHEALRQLLKVPGETMQDSVVVDEPGPRDLDQCENHIDQRREGLEFRVVVGKPNGNEQRAEHNDIVQDLAIRLPVESADLLVSDDIANFIHHFGVEAAMVR